MGGCLPSREYLRPIRGDADNGARTYCARRHSMEARSVSDKERDAWCLSNYRRGGGQEWRCLTPLEGGPVRRGRKVGQAAVSRSRLGRPGRQSQPSQPPAWKCSPPTPKSRDMRSISGPGPLFEIIPLSSDDCCCQPILCAYMSPLALC